MIIRTVLITKKSRSDIWSGITHAEMILPKPFLFRVGIPLPKKCEILTYSNGIGTVRKCTSDRGHVIQKITKFAVNRELEFHMEFNTLDIPCDIQSMSDNFLISEVGRHSQVIRTTNIKLLNDRLGLKSMGVWMGIKSVHRYVFNNIDAIVTSA